MTRGYYSHFPSSHLGNKEEDYLIERKEFRVLMHLVLDMGLSDWCSAEMERSV
jgi:hypothetical protein